MSLLPDGLGAAPDGSGIDDDGVRAGGAVDDAEGRRGRGCGGGRRGGGGFRRGLGDGSPGEADTGGDESTDDGGYDFLHGDSLVCVVFGGLHLPIFSCLEALKDECIQLEKHSGRMFSVVRGTKYKRDPLEKTTLLLAVHWHAGAYGVGACDCAVSRFADSDATVSGVASADVTQVGSDRPPLYANAITRLNHITRIECAQVSRQHQLDCRFADRFEQLRAEVAAEQHLANGVRISARWQHDTRARLIIAVHRNERDNHSAEHFHRGWRSFFNLVQSGHQISFRETAAVARYFIAQPDESTHLNVRRKARMYEGYGVVVFF